MFILQVTGGPDQGKKLQLEPGKSYTVGCNPDASLVLTDPLVLKGHCSVEIPADGSIVLRNHTATAGTFVGDQKISQAKLKTGSSFRIGATTLSVSPAPAPAASKPPPAPAPPDPLVGKIIGGYKLIELVGAGGMGKVYRATQLSLHRDVAFKILRDQHAKDKNFRDLFINEARAAAQLVHPNVVQVYDAGTEGDLVYFSMEFLGQGSTEEILEREKRIPWEKAILMVLEAAHGLQYAETKGIVHRDIKPDNLMLNEAGQVKIADLGLAKRGEGSGDQGIIGTPHFIPPEQALGKEVDHRADLYSLGATFFRMITGRTLFSGKTAKEIVLKHIKEPPPAASSVDETVPDDLDLVIAKMLAKEPSQRYQSATEVIAALEEVCAHHGIKGAIIKKGVGKRVLIPLVLLLLAAGGTVLYLATKPRSQAEIDRENQLKAEKDAEAKRAAELAEENRHKALQNRKGEVSARFSKRENDELRLQLDEPIEQVYDDEKSAPTKEQRWLLVAKDWEAFAEESDAKEFDSELELSSKATRHASDIRENLRKGKDAAQDVKEKSEAKIAEAKEIDAAKRRELVALRAESKFEAAARLCELIASFKPPKEDPFAAIVAWEWVSPIDPKIRRPAMTSFPQIKKVVDDSRAYFKEQKADILAEAKHRGDATNKAAAGIPDEADPAAIDQAIKELDAIRKFRDETLDDKEEKILDIRAIVDEARKQQDRLQKLLAKRNANDLQADRELVRDQQRKLASLNPEQLGNSMMNVEFQEADRSWNKLLVGGQIKTELYVRFAKERIAMAAWCEFLFARFYTDLEVTAKGAQKPLSRLDVDVVPFADSRLSDAILAAKDVGPYSFALNKSVAGLSSWRFAQFPMDWVHSSIFHCKDNTSRWAEVTPEIRFALGAFCFETMQYAEAAKHFDELLKNGDDRYTAAAKSFKARAEREAKAREAYESLLKELAAAKTAAEATAVKDKLGAYATEHQGTLFFVEVMEPGKDELKDFYPADAPVVPDAPPPPSPKE